MANEVFGFGNWDAETVEMKREHEPVQFPPSEEHPKGSIVVTYSARVRVTVYSQDGSRKVVRERSGGHRGFGPTVGQAVEDCIKAAGTDATKRAFVTFGNIFGLALYDREQRNVGAPERKQVALMRASSHRSPGGSPTASAQSRLRLGRRRREPMARSHACRTDRFPSLSAGHALCACWTFHRATRSRSIRERPNWIAGANNRPGVGASSMGSACSHDSFAHRRCRVI